MGFDFNFVADGRLLLAGIAMILVFIAFIIWVHAAYGTTTAPVPVPVQCIDFKKPFFQHIHVQVKGIKIPAMVGITYNCFKEMHTHTGSGIIHIESNTPKNFTLGQFFDVWGKSTMGYTSLTINGKPATFMTVLKDQDKIVIKP